MNGTCNSIPVTPKNGHDKIKKMLTDHEQHHIIDNWESLDKKEFKFLQNINLAQLMDALKPVLSERNNINNTSPKRNIDDDAMEPVEEECFGSVPRSDEITIKLWEEIGLSKIARGEVAVILLAGGQGSRLGVNYPKGMYNVGLPSNKTLYQLQAERIIKLQQIAEKFHPSAKKCVIPWYIMTSDSTKQQTEDFFEKNNYFNLSKENIVIFEQFTLPCIDFNGKLIMATKNSLKSSPDGNGGLYKALRNCEILADMKRRGIKCTHVYCVDNILVKMADPVFIGFCSQKEAECGAKVVEKVQPNEAVGVVCKVNQVYQVVEYSEISTATSERRNESTGRLTFSAGNICNHYFTLNFLEKVCEDECESKLQYHIAKKQIPCLSDSKPLKPNGYKLEKFVFDVFKFAEKFAVLEVSREDEFSPLKRADEQNGVGGDSNPRTSRFALMHLHHKQVVKAGGQIIGKDGVICKPVSSGPRDYPIKCELSPLVSYYGEGLEQYVKGKSFQSSLIL